MGLFSLFRKNKQESASDDSDFATRADADTNTARSRSKRKPRKQGNEALDPALPEKKRARRRLVGAVSLVMTAVIVLPMILDSEPKPLADDIAIHIPSKDTAPVRSQIPLAIPPQSVAAPPQMSAANALDKDEKVVQTSTPLAAPDKPKADATPQSGATSTAGIQPKPTSGIDAKIAALPMPAKKVDDSERAKAILEGRALAKLDKPADQSPSGSGRFLVQVAALASKDKVTQLQSKLKSAGIKSHTQKVATANGERIRIRVGPFANREDADRMRARIGKLGLNGTLVPV
jgi:DedD protein